VLKRWNETTNGTPQYYSLIRFKKKDIPLLQSDKTISIKLQLSKTSSRLRRIETT